MIDSITKTINNFSFNRTDMIYNIQYTRNNQEDLVPLAAIRKGKWKYIKKEKFMEWDQCPSEQCTKSLETELFDSTQQQDYTEDALFNLEDDPTETINLFESEPEVAKDLAGILEEYIAALPIEYYPDFDPSGDPDNFGGVWSDGWC